MKFLLEAYRTVCLRVLKTKITGILGSLYEKTTTTTKKQIVWNIKLFYVKYILKRKWAFIVDTRKNEGVLLEEKRIFFFCLNRLNQDF